MTKLYEEIFRERISDILKKLPEERIRGEFTLVVKGSDGKEGPEALTTEVLEKIDLLLKKNQASLKDIAQDVSLETGFPYRRIYKICLSRKAQLASTGTK